MKVSATEEHGLRCLMRLAIAWQAGRPVTIPEVARAEAMSPQYAAKLVSMLRRAGMVRSTRGIQGGVALARPPESIPVGEALAALAGAPVRTGPCMVPGGGGCGLAATCGLHEVWARVAEAVDRVLDGVTLADLVARGRPEAGGPGSGGHPGPARWKEGLA